MRLDLWKMGVRRLPLVRLPLWRAAVRPRVTWLLAALPVLAIGCDGGDPGQTNMEILPDMIDSVPYDSFAANPVTRDGKTLLLPAKGTVPRGFTPLHFGPGPEEAARAGRELKDPLPSTPENVARGGVLFKRFCSPCHGPGGAGDGSIVPPFPAPPPLTAERATKMPDGQIFHVMSYGQGLMPPHGAQISQADRWAIVQFVRSIQEPATSDKPATGGEPPATGDKPATSDKPATGDKPPATGEAL